MMSLMSCSHTQMTGINDCISYQPIYEKGLVKTLLRQNRNDPDVREFREKVGDNTAVWEDRCNE